MHSLIELITNCDNGFSIISLFCFSIYSSTFIIIFFDIFFNSIENIDTICTSKSVLDVLCMKIKDPFVIRNMKSVSNGVINAIEFIKNSSVGTTGTYIFIKEINKQFLSYFTGLYRKASAAAMAWLWS